MEKKTKVINSDVYCNKCGEVLPTKESLERLKQLMENPKPDHYAIGNWYYENMPNYVMPSGMTVKQEIELINRQIYEL